MREREGVETRYSLLDSITTLYPPARLAPQHAASQFASSSSYTSSLDCSLADCDGSRK
jgi:hypothetical protein